jgi:hypothetical protein
MSFGVPGTLGPCPHNVLNALGNRHLVSPKNVANPPFNFMLLPEVSSIMIAAFREHMDITDPDDWKRGKTTAKLSNINRSFAFDVLRSDAASSFVKREACNLSEAKHFLISKARLIQGNRNEFTAYNQPREYRAISYAVKALAGHDINICGVKFTLVYAAGYNHDELSDLVSDWISSPGKIYYDERDGKTWDATMQEPTLRAEAEVYKLFDSKIAELFLKRCEYVRGSVLMKKFIPGIIRYVTKWKRLSGDWNTSVGNTIISMLIAVTAILSLPAHLRPHAVKALFMGDDYLGLYYYEALPDSKELTQALNDGEEHCGITPERAIGTCPLRISFISLGLWPRRCGGYQFVPHPARQLQKLMWTTRDMTGRNCSEQATALYKGFAPIYNRFRLMQDFLCRHNVCRNSNLTLDQQDYYFHYTLSTRDRDVDWRSGFCAKYRLPFTATDWQLPTTPIGKTEVWYHPVFAHMLHFELSGPEERL